jgi:hypothetical protein
VDPVLEHHPVAHRVEAEPGLLPFSPNAGMDRQKGGEIPKAVLGRHDDVDLVGLAGDGGPTRHVVASAISPPSPESRRRHGTNRAPFIDVMAA